VGLLLLLLLVLMLEMLEMLVQVQVLVLLVEIGLLSQCQWRGCLSETLC
jgi:hypothetical protein